MKEELQKLFQPMIDQIDGRLAKFLDQMGQPEQLVEACRYALFSGGKRFRPSLLLLVAEALQPEKLPLDGACAVELFHTASLIADDLPCMDNDDCRRGLPSLHRKYGEATALLASYALIAGGYQLIGEEAKGASSSVALQALESASKNTGIHGATGGQYLDLFPPHLNEKMVFEVFRKKTGTLFELSFVLGWLFGGGDLSLLPTVEATAHHFGLAFQLADDLTDLEKDHHSMNIISVIGKGKAFEMFHVELSSYYKGLVALELETSLLPVLGKKLAGHLTDSFHVVGVHP